MDSNEVLRHALNISETAISSSGLIASWTGIAVGMMALIFTIGLVLLGIRYWGDRDLVAKKVKQEVSEAVLALQLRYDKKFEDESSSLMKKFEAEKSNHTRQIEVIQKELAYVWIRNVVTSENKDLQAIMKAIEMPMATGQKDMVIAMVQELNSFAENRPQLVGHFMWDALKVDDLLERVKTFFTGDEDNLVMANEYAKQMTDLAATNRESRKAKKRMPA